MEAVQPTVSVVIPTYNHAAFLRDALSSLIGQTYIAWEAIVVNNHSEDDTIAVVESFADTRLRLENFSNHGVIAASRNHGMTLARGRYIAFLDSDDVWYPRKLERCMERLDGGCDVVCHAERWHGGGCDRAVLYGPTARASYDALLYEGNCISTSAVVVRREHIEAVGGFCEDPAMITAEDYDLWLRLIGNGARIEFVHEVLGEYRIHSGGQSRAILRNMDATMFVVRRHLATLGPGGLLRRLRTARREAVIYYSGARGLQDAGRYEEAWPLLGRSLREWPFGPKLYAAIILNILAAIRRRL